MRNNNFKTPNEQIPSKQGRAAEITSLLDSFFDYASPDEVEDVLFGVFDEYLHPTGEYSSLDAASNLFAIRKIVNLTRGLETINNQLKGGLSC